MASIFIHKRLRVKKTWTKATEETIEAFDVLAIMCESEAIGPHSRVLPHFLFKEFATIWLSALLTACTSDEHRAFSVPTSQ